MTENGDIDVLMRFFSKLPGLGPRSARRAVLHLINHRETLLEPLIRQLTAVKDGICVCPVCGNVDTQTPCAVCADEKRDPSVLCVVRDVADLWALERSNAFRGRYHVLGGLLSPLDGVTPKELKIDQLENRIRAQNVSELIFALPATMEGQTTVLYIADRLKNSGVKISSLAQGIPMGGELDYLDDGTIRTALNGRRFY